MKGAFFRYYVRFCVVNFGLLFMIILFEAYINNSIFDTYTLGGVIWNYKQIFIDKLLLNSPRIYIYFYIAIFINLYLLYWLIRYFKYLGLPYSLNLYNDIRQLEGFNKKTKISHDKFIKKVKHDRELINKFSLIFKNPISINIDKYRTNSNFISQFLNWSGEVEVEEFGTKGIELVFFDLPKKYEASKLDLKKEYINFGISNEGHHFITLENLTSLICVGESGSGKSNFMHYVLQSLLLSTKIEELHLIDLKGTELYRYKKFKNISFIDEIESVKETLQKLKQIMNQRFQMMKQSNDQIYNGKYTFVIIDEIGTIGTCPDKKLRDEVFNLMIELAQKGRASKILLFVFAQKIDSTNIPSNVLTNLQTKVLMKTDSDFNINNTIGKKEDIQKITRLDPSDFPRGRAIIKNGVTSDKTLIQVPFVKFKNKDD